ncbi:MAG: DUF4157 domain-containing protein [Undibacterium umbellatum]|uniref:eCIS core domain-containing protein n=1 Tax=Undibacterium umbellatum TaxID=2762300 RepID=UPI003BB59590
MQTKVLSRAKAGSVLQRQPEDFSLRQQDLPPGDTFGDYSYTRSLLRQSNRDSIPITRPVVQRQIAGTNDTGLPDQLKAGIEALSGMSMDGVKVHYNSSKPAQLSALAYAQGHNIYLGPGQGHQLPHEAWHLVQQRQQRVDPTMHQAGVAINDDPHLEQEADRMGTQAKTTSIPRHSNHFTDTQINPHASAMPQQVAQRAISVKVHNKMDDYVVRINDFMQALSDAVEKARLYILNVPELGAYNVDGHTQHWIDTWNDYKTNGDANMINAAFGYAVETIATQIYLPDAPSGLQAITQVPRGGTRPDLILASEDTHQDVAWLDITSDSPQSVRHIISDKVSWELQDHYGEVTYPALSKVDLTNMLSAPGVFDDKMDKGEFWAKRRFAMYVQGIREGAWRKLGLEKFNNPKKTRGDEIIRYPVNREDIKERLEKYFHTPFDDRMAASILYAMGVGLRKFGFNNSVSMNYGQSLLLNHDPNLPVFRMPRLGVPRPMPLQNDEREYFASRLLYGSGMAQELTLPDTSNSNAIVPLNGFGTDFKGVFGQSSSFSGFDGFFGSGNSGLNGFSNVGSSFFPTFSFGNSTMPNLPGFGRGGVEGFSGYSGFRSQSDFGTNSMSTLSGDKANEKRPSISEMLAKTFIGREMTPQQLFLIEQLIGKLAKSRARQIMLVKVILRARNGDFLVIKSNLLNKSRKFQHFKRNVKSSAIKRGGMDSVQPPIMSTSLTTQPPLEIGSSDLSKFDFTQSYRLMAIKMDDDAGNSETIGTTENWD